MTILHATISEFVLQSGSGGPSIIQILTFLGVLTTIKISHASLNQQRNAAARESLEQLDGLTFKNNDVRVRAILQSYPKWPKKKSVVKIKFSRMTDVSDISQRWSNLWVVPAHIFEGYEVEIERNGYLVTIESADPMTIRTEVDRLLTKINEECRSGDHRARISHEGFLNQYSGALRGEEEEVHRIIKAELEMEKEVRHSQLRNLVSGSGINQHLPKVAVRDLVARGEVEENKKNGNKVYSLAEVK